MPLAINLLAPFVPYTVKVYHNERVLVRKEVLRALLDPMEARSIQLSTEAYYNVVERILDNSDGHMRITVLLEDKESGEPVGLATFLEHEFDDFEKSSPLPVDSDLRRDLMTGHRKVYYELQYCLRKITARGKRVGHALLGCGLEAIVKSSNRRPAVITVWLLLAGSFANLPAFSLYTDYKFKTVGLMEGKTPIMVLRDCKSIVEKASMRLRRTLEETFLLPILKQQQSRTESNFQLEEHEHSFSEDCVPSESEAAAGDYELSQASDLSSQHLGASQNADLSGEPSTASTQESRREEQPPALAKEGQQLLQQLIFRKYQDHLQWSSNVLLSLSGVPEGRMLENVSAMARRSVSVDRSHAFLQHLQMAKQIEEYAACKQQNSLNVLEEIRTQIMGEGQDIDYSLSYLQRIVRLSWCVHRYAFLEQLVTKSWTQALEMIPRAARMLDGLIKDQRPFPENILRAQRDRFSVYLKISLSFPEIFPPGDGDGLTDCQLLRVHGVYRNQDEPVGDELTNVCSFQGIRSIEGEILRCRLVGFDTQEKPIEPGPGRLSRLVPVPQHFWEMGRDFLASQLQELKGDLTQNEAVLVCDCYGLDVYKRLLVDVRGLQRRGSVDVLNTSLQRFEMAERFLSNGVAHPTYESYTDERLIAAFASARQSAKGAYGDLERREFVHPSLYRIEHRRMVNDMRKRSRPIYWE